MEASDASVTQSVTNRLRRYYVYVLFSQKDKGLYIGYSTNLKNRILQHSQGKVQSTKYRRPLTLIHYEYFIDITDAKEREEFLKSGFGREQLRKSLKRTLSVLHYL